MLITEIASTNVEVAFNTAFLGQFMIILCLAISLKSLWNLMHVMQIMAYLRMLIELPLNAETVLIAVYQAVNFEKILP